MNKFMRQQLKKNYKYRYHQDGKEVGRRINALSQNLMKMQVGGVDPESIEAQESLKELIKLRKSNRFKQDFPSFAKFKKFLQDEDVPFAEAMEV